MSKLTIDSPEELMQAITENPPILIKFLDSISKRQKEENLKLTKSELLSLLTLSSACLLDVIQDSNYAINVLNEQIEDISKKYDTLHNAHTNIMNMFMTKEEREFYDTNNNQDTNGTH